MTEIRDTIARREVEIQRLRAENQHLQAENDRLKKMLERANDPVFDDRNTDDD